MNKVTAAIIEDEYPAARLLHNILATLRPDWEILLIPGTIEESVEWFAKNPHPDILFLDIQLTDGNSFMFIEQAKPDSMIVFTTAYDEYAIRAFSVNSIDYLLKPIHQERLLETLYKFENLSKKQQQEYSQQDQLLEVLQSLSKPDKKFRTRFLISSVDKLFALQIDDISYFYSENRVTFAVTKQNKELIIDLSLDKLNEQLNPDLFFRTNRQTIVSIGAIQRIEPYFQNRIIVHITPQFKEKILVSREKITAFKLWLNY